MDEAWNQLLRAGLPDGAARPAPVGPVDARAIRVAVADLLARPGIELREGELLLAWLGGFRRHWPETFRSILGDDGERLIGRLERLPIDPNRYLKLRRIAIANLAGRL